jgi:CxxC motif-containing protein (DUF1111 family)
LFGAGLIEAIPDAVIRTWEDPTDRNAFKWSCQDCVNQSAKFLESYRGVTGAGSTVAMPACPGRPWMWARF